jgi:N-methylhydantoinase A
VELLNVRLAASGMAGKPPLAREPRHAPSPAAALKGRRPVWLAARARFGPVPVYDGDRLGHGNRLAGPAIVETANTSIVVPPRWRAEYDSVGNCILMA